MEKSNLFTIRFLIVIVLLATSLLFIIERNIGNKSDLKTFDSYKELKTFVNSTRAYSNYYGFERAITSDVTAADSGLKSAESGASYSISM